MGRSFFFIPIFIVKSDSKYGHRKKEITLNSEAGYEHLNVMHNEPAEKTYGILIKKPQWSNKLYIILWKVAKSKNPLLLIMDVCPESVI